VREVRHLPGRATRLLRGLHHRLPGHGPHSVQQQGRILCSSESELIKPCTLGLLPSIPRNRILVRMSSVVELILGRRGREDPRTKPIPVLKTNILWDIADLVPTQFQKSSSHNPTYNTGFVCCTFYGKGNGANVFCFLSSIHHLPTSHHGSVWLLPVISIFLTNTGSLVRACLSI
jgi:hypothetical protein